MARRPLGFLSSLEARGPLVLRRRIRTRTATLV